MYSLLGRGRGRGLGVEGLEVRARRSEPRARAEVPLERTRLGRVGLFLGHQALPTPDSLGRAPRTGPTPCPAHCSVSRPLLSTPPPAAPVQ